MQQLQMLSSDSLPIKIFATQPPRWRKRISNSTSGNGTVAMIHAKQSIQK